MNKKEILNNIDIARHRCEVPDGVKPSVQMIVRITFHGIDGDKGADISAGKYSFEEFKAILEKIQGA